MIARLYLLLTLSSATGACTAAMADAAPLPQLAAFALCSAGAGYFLRRLVKARAI